VGKGAFFTRLDWVVDQFERALGFRPFPGTLNVRISEEDVPKLESFFSQKDGELVPDTPEFCSAWLRKVWVNGIRGASAFPSEDVRVHESAIIEIMAGCHLKQTLRLADGDHVTIADGEK
jgi:riboflavin kinase